MRAVWPDDKPMSVRLSASDWVRGRPDARGLRRHRPRLRRGRLRPDRRLRRPDLGDGAPRLRPHVPDPVQRPHPQRGGRAHHGGRQHLSRPTTSTPSSPPAAPTCAPWPGRIWPIRTGACAPPPNWAGAASSRRSSTAPASPSWPATSNASSRRDPYEPDRTSRRGHRRRLGHRPRPRAERLAAGRLSGHPDRPPRRPPERDRRPHRRPGLRRPRRRHRPGRPGRRHRGRRATGSAPSTS